VKGSNLLEELRQIFVRHGLSSQFSEQQPLLIWDRVVGENIRRITAPLYVRSSVLYVETPSHVVSQELSLMKELLLRKLNEALGEERLKDIKFKVGKIKHYKQEGSSLEGVSLSVEEQEKIKQIVAKVEDAKLKEALERFMVTMKKVEKVREQEGWKRCPSCSTLHPGTEALCFACKLESSGRSA